MTTDTELIARYKKDIEETITDCEHVYRLTIDYVLLDEKLKQILKMAKKDGIDDTIIWKLIVARIPSYVNYLNSRVPGKKAA